VIVTRVGVTLKQVYLEFGKGDWNTGLTVTGRGGVRTGCVVVSTS
jgi:hypothetical protein